MSQSANRDHGGGIDAAIKVFGGSREGWLDLSTGINPVAYELPDFNGRDWSTLPDTAMEKSLLDAARQFWAVPVSADIVAASGASALIARIPMLLAAGNVHIETPTYNEHAGAFTQAGWSLSENGAQARVVVHPNNPDGRLWSASELAAPAIDLLVIDESFCDVTPDQSHIDLAGDSGVVILKSFGKFWGLAGVRLGFAIGRPDVIEALRQMLGPWPVSGPALRVGALALCDQNWARETRLRLKKDAARIDDITQGADLRLVGGTDLFRLYDAKQAKKLQSHLAKHHIWSRIFPYSDTWIRLGLPGCETDWQRLQVALSDVL